MAALKAAGVAEVFGPGSPLSSIMAFVAGQARAASEAVILSLDRARRTRFELRAEKARRRSSA